MLSFFVMLVCVISMGAPATQPAIATREAQGAPATAPATQPYDDLFRAAQGYEKANELSRAYGVYELILHKDPNNYQATFGRAEVLAAMGQSNDALADYQHCLAMRPKDPLVFNNIGLLDAQRGELKDAVGEYDRALAIAPKNMPALLNKANAEFQLGAYSRARDTLEFALKVDPHNSTAWLNAGVMAETVGDLASAERYAKYAIHCDNQSSAAWTEMGMIDEKEDKYQFAAVCYERALRLNPYDSKAKESLGHLHPATKPPVNSAATTQVSDAFKLAPAFEAPPCALSPTTAP
jgi:tetratricopeptide (TPR) repeat protein